MSFEKLNDEALREAAEMFAVDLDTSLTPAGKVSKKLAVAAFAEEGVTFEMYSELKAQREQARQEILAAEAEEARLEAERAAAVVKAETLIVDDEVEPQADFAVTTRKRKRGPNELLVKMDRQNPYYEVRGRIFTREHPFVLMTEDEAQDLFDADSGFRVATPREAAEYYS